MQNDHFSKTLYKVFKYIFFELIGQPTAERRGVVFAICRCRHIVVDHRLLLLLPLLLLPLIVGAAAGSGCDKGDGGSGCGWRPWWGRQSTSTAAAVAHFLDAGGCAGSGWGVVFHFDGQAMGPSSSAAAVVVVGPAGCRLLLLLLELGGGGAGTRGPIVVGQRRAAGIGGAHQHLIWSSVGKRIKQASENKDGQKKCGMNMHRGLKTYIYYVILSKMKSLICFNQNI
jgi:hypothetical protein